MDQQLITRFAQYDKIREVSTEIIGELFGVLARKGIGILRYEGMAVIQENDAYRIECHSEVSIASAFELKSPFEVAMLVMANSWDIELEAAFERILAKYGVITPGDILSISDEPRQKLGIFRHAVLNIVEKGAVEKPIVNQAPAHAPLVGELVDDEEEEKDWTDEERRAKANEVVYAPLDGLPVGSTITEIILIPNAGEAEGHIIYNAVRLKNMSANMAIDLDDQAFDRMVFVLNTGNAFILHNSSEGDSGCDVHISLVDIEGDLFDLIERPLVVSEVASYEPPDECCDSETWTYYRFATPKGFVSLRWFSRSNSYYSEAVSSGLVGPLQIPQALVVGNYELEDLIEKYEETLQLPKPE